MSIARPSLVATALASVLVAPFALDALVPAGPFAGQTNVWTLAAGGSYASAIGASSLSGTWSLDGTTLTVTDTGSNPTYLACPAGQRGTYRVDFAASCNGITLHAIEEPCDGRRVALDGFAPTRR